MDYEYVEASNWWYLAPLFFSALGGLIAYVALRHEDPPKAGYCLGFGIFMFVIEFFVVLFTLS